MALTEATEIANIEIHAPARQGRRGAVMPTDQLLMSQRPSLASQTESTDGAETEDERSAPSSRRAHDMASDVQKFLATLQTNIDKGENDEDDDDHDGSDTDDRKADPEDHNNLETLITRQRIRRGVPLCMEGDIMDSDSSHYSE